MHESASLSLSIYSQKTEKCHKTAVWWDALLTRKKPEVKQATSWAENNVNTEVAETCVQVTLK